MDYYPRATSLDMIGLFFRVLQYRWLILSLLAAGIVLAGLLTLMQTPRYQAIAKLEVLVPSARVFEDLELTSESSDIRAFQTAREKLKSRALAERVVYALNLTEREDFLFPRARISPLNIFYRAFGSEPQKTDSSLPPDALMRIATSRVMSNLKVELVPNTSLLTIDYRDQNPAYARDIANQIAQSFIDLRIDQSSKTSVQAREFIQEQVALVKERLQESERALVAYAKTAGITVTGNEGSLLDTNLSDINAALSKAVQENLDFDRLVKQIDAGQGDSLEQVLGSAALDKLRGTLIDLKGDYESKRLLFKPDFPEMRQLASQIRETEKQLKMGVLAITDSIRLKHQETVAKVADLQKKITELEAEKSTYQDKNIQYTILKREVDSNRAQYDSLIGKLNDVAVGSELKTQNAAVVDLAVSPTMPFSPSLPINIAIGSIISLLLAASVIYVAELINNAFSNSDQVEKELGLPVLGVLPLVPEIDLEQQLTNPQSALSETYRSLRTSLQFSGAEGAPATLLVTSSEPGEGKSTTVIKLAEDFASLGGRVLIIDADMRKPSIHRRFNEDNVIGLSNLLTNTVRRGDLARLVRRGKSSNVFFISAGTVPQNPADLLSSPRMSLIVSSLRKQFDMIIIDAPPVIGIADVPILSRLADATLFIVSTSKVSRKSVTMAVRRLTSAGANVVGVALTMFTVGKFEHNYRYGNLNYKYYTYSSSSNLLPEVSSNTEGQDRDVWNWSVGFVVFRVRQHFDNILDRIKSIA
ncbi:polysaccharide biosynthesis tyrosine autokinase [Rhizobium sp. AG855]|uniref:GumC family protein n=1 Tax=Rhizobium sp. AG855 TaxID=2183898 RepID=UPI001FE05ADF|nr:polysaccharide biosynthesis tyrosine autokinase [Rhizobium sp. AG855]